MALIKDITLVSGHTCSYWKIISISKDFTNDTGMVRLAGYKDKEARDEGRPALADSIKVYNGFTGHGGTEEAYDWLKNLTVQVSTAPSPNPDFDIDKPESPENQRFIYQGPTSVPGEFHEAIDG